MSNDQFANKNPAWGRSNPNQNIMSENNQHINVIQSQMLNQGLNNMSNSNMIQFPQQHPQVFQGTIGMQQQTLGLGFQQINNPIASPHSQLTNNQIFQPVGAVSYPNPRALNSAAFQTNPNLPAIPNQNNNNTGMKQKVFTGTVTKVHDNFGFVDDDVFFQTNACIKGSNPVVGDRVLVEASYNPSMPFKWNATKIQVLVTNSNQTRHLNPKSFNNSNNSYNAGASPMETNGNFGNRNSLHNRSKSFGNRGRERSRERERDDEEPEKKRRRDERMREREKDEKKSPVRRRSRSPKARRRLRIVPRYMVQIPKITLNLSNVDVLELRRRYGNMYIPSDFFYSNIRWVDAFPPNKPFSLSKPCSFHIMSKDIDPLVENEAILEPQDADYKFSAKVMLMSLPGLEEIYSKCCSMAEDEDKKDRDGEERDFIHPSRMIKFLIGIRGKNETMTIGGPWSPSLDGPNPDRDPAVLIKTAIRTCKALTGIDLSSCTQWYRFVELYYRRSETMHKGKPVPARVETVVIFLPDIWSCVPTRLEWDNLVKLYQKRIDGDALLPESDQAENEQHPTDEKEEDHGQEKSEPTHFSLLDPKAMNVQEIKQELKARNANYKGLKNQLIARLSKLLKVETEKGGNAEPPVTEIKVEKESTEEEKNTEPEEKKIDDKDKSVPRKKYTFPEQQHIIVHPSKIAKSGKFDCTIMSLSLLLDYQPEDTKEHSFEVSLFAELFNEMLIRDFGFNIYKALHELPEKLKEREEKKKKEDEKKKDEKKKDDRKKDDDVKDKKLVDAKDDKKDRKGNKTDESEDDDDDERKKDKKKKVRMYTAEKHLLLSFIYFDQTHCGYIFDKDVEDLFYTLGLNLSRAQVRKLLSKVIARDSLHYRKLTDKSKDENPAEVTKALDEADVQNLSMGNRSLLPVFEQDASKPAENGEQSDGLFLYQGALVDVKKLLSQLERNDNARLDTENRMVNLKNENSKLLEKYNKLSTNAKHTSNELKEYKDKLRNTEDHLSRLTTQAKLFQSTLVEIKDKIEPVLKTAHIKEEFSIKREEKKNDENSRWEKDVKLEDNTQHE